MPAKTKSPAVKKDSALRLSLFTLLTDCRQQLDTEHRAIETAREAFEKNSRYHRLTIGLFLLIARDAYLIPNDGSRGGGHDKRSPKLACAAAAHASNQATTSPPVDSKHQTSCPKPPESFEHFLDTIDWLPRRNAYAYMKAAENSGLTAKSSRQDIKRLRDNKTLDGLTGPQWTALCSNDPDGSQDSPTSTPSQPAFDFYADNLTGIISSGKTARQLRPDLTHTRYATLAAAMLRELEAFTGQNLAPDPSAPDYDPNHWQHQWPDADLEALK